MTDMDLINELGLGTATAAPAEASAAAGSASAAEPEDAVEAKSRPERSELKIVGEIKTGLGLLPAKQAFGGGGGGKRGSKYPFESLAAPTKNDAGEVTGYSFFEVKMSDVENADEKKLKGAIQAAVAAQNKSAKEAGEVTKYVSRALIENGAYVGTAVYRVDDTLGSDDD